MGSSCRSRLQGGMGVMGIMGLAATSGHAIRAFTAPRNHHIVQKRVQMQSTGGAFKPSRFQLLSVLFCPFHSSRRPSAHSFTAKRVPIHKCSATNYNSWRQLQLCKVHVLRTPPLYMPSQGVFRSQAACHLCCHCGPTFVFSMIHHPISSALPWPYLALPLTTSPLC